jgi:hypothetical protein
MLHSIVLSRQLDRQTELHIQHKYTDRGFRCLSTLNTMIDTTAGKHWGVYHTQTHNNIQPGLRPREKSLETLQSA